MLSFRKHLFFYLIMAEMSVEATQQVIHANLLEVRKFAEIYVRIYKTDEVLWGLFVGLPKLKYILEEFIGLNVKF